MNDTSNSERDDLPPPLRQALHDALAAKGHAIPVTPDQVAFFDRSAGADAIAPADEATVDRFMKRWSAFKAESAALPSGPTTPSEDLPLAARSGTAISNPTKSTISGLVRDMQKEDPHGPAR